MIPASRARLENHPRLCSSAELAVVQAILAPLPTTSGAAMSKEAVDPASRTALPVVIRCLRDAHARLGDTMAPTIGAAIHLSTFGIPGFALMSAATLMDALLQARAIWPLLNLRYDLQFVALGDRTRIVLGDRLGLDEEGAPIFAPLEIARIVTMCRDLLGWRFDPVRIGICDASDGAETGLRTMTHADIVAAPTAFIEIPARAMHAPLPQANRATHQQIGAMCGHMLEELFCEPPLVRRIKTRMAQMERGVPSLSEIAAMLCMSERTLRRRLHDMGTSYYRLLDEVRMEMAECFLRDTAVTTDRIAESLGYAEVSNFCHAFRRWTGNSPRHFRLQAQG